MFVNFVGLIFCKFMRLASSAQVGAGKTWPFTVNLYEILVFEFFALQILQSSTYGMTNDVNPELCLHHSYELVYTLEPATKHHTPNLDCLHSKTMKITCGDIETRLISIVLLFLH